MSTKSHFSRSKLFPILLVLISALFLQAFQSPANRLTTAEAAADDTAQDVAGGGATEDIAPETDKTHPPRIHATIKADPVSGVAPLTVEFSARFEQRVNPDKVAVLWSFGNGDTATSMDTKYTFNEPGEYTVLLVIRDSRAEYIVDRVLITVYPATRVCSSDCLIAEKLQLEPGDVGETTMILGSVLVMNENGRSMEGAAVLLVWTQPDGHQVVETVLTDREGVAKSKIQANISGRYSLQVERIELKDWTFDPTRSVLLADIRR